MGPSILEASLARRSAYAEFGSRSRRCCAPAGGIPQSNESTASRNGPARASFLLRDKPLLVRPPIRGHLSLFLNAKGQKEIVPYGERAQPASGNAGFRVKCGHPRRTDSQARLPSSYFISISTICASAGPSFDCACVADVNPGASVQR